MRYFDGDVSSAISLAKEQGSIFTVFIEGTDDHSKQMSNLIEFAAPKLEAKEFVVIKIQSDKEEYKHFARIYQLVPVPSIFFIKNGIPIKIITNVVKTEEDMTEAIDNLLKNNVTISPVSSSQQQQSVVTPSPVVETSAMSKEPEVVCEDGVCYKKDKASEETASATEPLQSNETEDEKQEKIKKAMKLIEQKRIERIQEEQRLERELEIRRRKEGQELQNLKKWQEDQELQQIKDDRKREKEEAKAARDRVLAQIEQDKLERAQRFGTPSSPSEPQEQSPPATQATTPSSTPLNSTRIQFRKPDGDSESCTFDISMPFSDLFLYVKETVLANSVKDFTLATSFPRREFTQTDFDKNLLELGLAPSAVLLIIFGKRQTVKSGPSSILPTQTDGSFMDMIGALIMGLFSPVAALFAYMKNFVFRNRGEAANEESPNEAGKRKRNEDILTPNEAAKKRNLKIFEAQPEPGTSGGSSSPTGTIPKSTAYKRPASNIHRLHDNDGSDDEEKKTYNGNSTQQM